jgi:hypothetical protein
VQARIELQQWDDASKMKAAMKKARDQTNAINQALTSLQTCMQTIVKAVQAAQKSDAAELLIPRGAFKSPLTKLLANALKPARLPAGEENKASKVMMICCVAAAYTWHETTLSSLDFALNCMKIKLESPAQQAAKKPLIDKLTATKDVLEALREKGEAHLAEDFLAMESDAQRAWYTSAKAIVRDIEAAHRAASAMAST